MNRLNLAAIVAGTAGTAISLVDAAWRATQTSVPPWDDTLQGMSFADVLLNGTMIAAYATGAAVLVKHARAIDVNRVAQWSRRLLVCTLAVLAMSYSALLALSRPAEGAFAAVFGIALIFVLTLPVVLGLSLIRRPQFRSAALVLASPIVVGPLTGLVAAFTSWGHPAYVETAGLIGVPLLAILAATTRPDDGHALRTPTALEATVG